MITTELIQTKASTYSSGIIYICITYKYHFVFLLIVPVSFGEETH